MSDDIPDLDKQPVAVETSIAEQVPVIDISGLLCDASSPEAVKAINDISQACLTWGFFQVVNHSISSELIEHTRHQMHAFFALPIEDKSQLLRTRSNPWGFNNNELTKNQRDKKEVFDFTRDGIDPIYGQSNRWPVNQNKFKSVMMAYYNACTNLSLKLLEAFCLGLELPADYMHADFVDNHTGFIRLNYYPVRDPLVETDLECQAEADLGVHHHTDAGALTVLLQDHVGGLQVYRDGLWHDIPPVADALVINTGDMMQVWSNDIYQAPVHRVLAMEAGDRYSIPFFLNPAANARVSPLPTVISEVHPSHYETIEWAGFRGKRSDGDYADYGTEVQISQFRK